MRPASSLTPTVVSVLGGLLSRPCGSHHQFNALLYLVGFTHMGATEDGD